MFNAEARNSKVLSLALVLAFTLFALPAVFVDQAQAKEAFAEQVFAEEAFAKEVLADEEAAGEEGSGAPEVEWSQDVFYKDWEGNPLKGPVSGAPAPELGPNDYDSYSFVPSRILIWIANQQHLYFGSFVLAVPIFCMLIEFIGIRTKENDPVLSAKYDRLAHDLMKVSLTAYSWTAILGGILLFSFITLFPGFFKYMASIFRPVMHVYALMFLAESGVLYVYYYGWDKMSQDPFLKWIHCSLSVLLNLIGTILMYLANSWATFMQAPGGIDEQGRFLGNIWHAIHSTLWNPVGVHRILGNIVFGGGIVGAYAAYHYLKAKTPEEKAHYDWVCYIAMFIAIFGLIPLPFAGYWLMKEVYAFRQQMGITLMGGIMAWLFIIQAVMIGLLFFGANSYLHNSMSRVKGSHRYMKYCKYMVLLLILCFTAWMTPHTIVMTPAELKAMGGAQHPIVGHFGVMSAKNTAVNLMITCTVLCFLLYQRSNKRIVVPWATIGNCWLTAIFIGAAINIVFLGVYGYFLPANQRVGLSVPQVTTTLTTLFVGTAINISMFKDAESFGEIEWGTQSKVGTYAILLMAISFTWLMGLMGYIRSAVRLFWHVTEVLRDNSVDAYTLTIGEAGKILTFNALFVWVQFVVVFWVGGLAGKKKAAEVPEGVPVPAQQQQ
ncbi:cytochrome ubiquinol oxidase subunit I [Nitrospina sp. 32_T5]|uniref:cytochrome ubiquinol oxidase subunit I n=1 Tax=unclassified Nitrospina TaxID=2638683 RepID=UPI003F94D3E6